MLFLRLWLVAIASVFFQGVVSNSPPDIKVTASESASTGLVGNVVADCAVCLTLSVLKNYPGCCAWLISSPDYKKCIDVYHAAMMERGLLEQPPRWSCYDNNEFVEIAKAGLYPCSNEISTALLLLESDEEYRKAVMEVYPDSVEVIYEISEAWRLTELSRQQDSENRWHGLYSVKERVYHLHADTQKNVAYADCKYLFDRLDCELVRAAQIVVPTGNQFNCDMLDNSVDCLESAIDVALYGDSATASKLVDCAGAALDYLSAIAEGVVVGAKNSLEGLCNTVLHPLETVQALGRLAGSIARAIPDYIPPEVPDPDASVEEFEKYEQRLAVVKANLSNAYAQARTWWDTTPTREKIKQGSQLCTEWVLFDRCMGLLHKAGRAAFLEARSGKIGLGCSKIELARTAPGYMLLRECETTASLMATGMQYGFTAEQVEHAIVVLEKQVGGCRHKLNEMMIKLAHVEGVEKNIDMIMRGNKGNVKGFYFELEAACMFMEKGEEINALGVKIKRLECLKEFDIVTKSKLIECKSWNWEHKIKDQESLRNVILSLKARKNIVDGLGKDFLLVSKQTIPDRLKSILLKENIAFLEV